MIHWIGKTNGGITIYETEVHDSIELLDELMMEGIIQPYWEMGSQLAYFLAQENQEFKDMYESLPANELKKFNLKKLLHNMSENDILNLIKKCDDQAFEQVVTIRQEGGENHMNNFEFVKVRLEKYIREINAAQSKALVLQNELIHDVDLEDVDAVYKEDWLHQDDTRLSLNGYYGELKSNINDVIKANDELLQTLYAAKRSYYNVSKSIEENKRKKFSF